MYYLIIGISNSSALGKSMRVIYIDNLGGNDFSVLSENFNYDFSPLDITLFSTDPLNTQRTSGHFDLSRFMILDSGSPAVNFFNYHSNTLVREAIFRDDNIQDKLC